MFSTLNLVLQQQPGHALEFPQIAARQCVATAAGVPGDVQVVDTDGLPLLFQRGADLSVVRGIGMVVGDGVQTADEVLQGTEVAGRIVAFLHAVQQFSQCDAGDGRATVVAVEGIQHFKWPALDGVDGNVGVQQGWGVHGALRSSCCWLGRSAMKSSEGRFSPLRKKLSQADSTGAIMRLLPSTRTLTFFTCSGKRVPVGRRTAWVWLLVKTVLVVMDSSKSYMY